jgi:hypothetical protein
MMDLNQSTINTILHDLNRTIHLHTHSLDFYPDCLCNTPEVIGKCFKCRTNEIIDDLSCLQSHLEPFAKNTINSIHFIDVESFCFTLNQQSNIDSISIEPVYLAPEHEYNPDDPNCRPIGYHIFAKYSRYTMDGSGYHVGYENVTFKWEAIDKTQLGISGLPYLLSRWVVNPDQYEIESKDLPPNEHPEHDSDCEFKHSTEFDNCDCADYFEGYYQPEDDFFYQEMDCILEQCNWVEAEFNSEDRIWELGNTSFEMDEYQNNPEYADSCNEDNGAPTIGEYS